MLCFVHRVSFIHTAVTNLDSKSIQASVPMGPDAKRLKLLSRSCMIKGQSGPNLLDASIALKFDKDNPDDILYRFNLLSRSYSQRSTYKVSFQRHKIDIYYKPLLCPVWSIQVLRVNPPHDQRGKVNPQKLKKAPTLTPPPN